MQLCIMRGELRLSNPTEAADDQHLAPGFLGQQSGLKLLLDVLQLFFTFYKVIDGDALAAERYIESVYHLEPVSVFR
jgi:hypothetical protein